MAIDIPTGRRTLWDVLARVFVILVLAVSLGTARPWAAISDAPAIAELDVAPDPVGLEELAFTRHVACNSTPHVVRSLAQVRVSSPPPSIDMGGVFRPPRSFGS